MDEVKVTVVNKVLNWFDFSVRGWRPRHTTPKLHRFTTLASLTYILAFTK